MRVGQKENSSPDCFLPRDMINKANMSDKNLSKPWQIAQQDRVKMSKQHDQTAEKAPPEKYLLLVLGMHRSGTSALGGMLHHLGCTLPATLMQEGASNTKGHFESHAIQAFNDRALKAARSHWRDWRPLHPNWLASVEGQAFLAQAQDLLEAEYGSAPLVLLKDPRICRMTPFWTEAAERSGYTVQMDQRLTDTCGAQAAMAVRADPESRAQP